MEKEFYKGKLLGYEIGEHISVHPHIHDPESWFLTIRPLSVHGKRLCKKTCSEAEIARYVYLELHQILNFVNKAIADFVPFTSETP